MAITFFVRIVIRLVLGLAVILVSSFSHVAVVLNLVFVFHKHEGRAVANQDIGGVRISFSSTYYTVLELG